MALEPGTRLGPYEITAPLGAGGMGEVYRARDTRLDRTVAIKVLPAHLAQSAEFRQRFEREARAVSSLNHPHICTLHDVGEQGGVHFLVMEHLQGETLASRLERGPLPADEALPLAIQVADALDRAHRQGLVHRDLKPGNLMLTKSGAKLLDFGLAKAAEAGPAALSGMTAAPTIASPLTAHGAVVGTFQYMAPEQLEGAPADARSDIFAFGVVLYEMVTGRRAFEGKTQASLVAAILKESPRPVTALEPRAPAALDRLIGTCLVKDPEQRRQTMHDVLLELRWIASHGAQVDGSAAGSAAAPRPKRDRTAWTVAAIALAVAATSMAWSLFLSERGVAGGRARFQAEMLPPSGTSFEYRHGLMALSPDGKQVVFPARGADGERQLWLRAFDQPSAEPLEGTRGGSSPFWSPDGRSIGFFAEGKLKRIEAAGGAPDTISDEADPLGGSWNTDDVVVFTPGRRLGLHRIAATGGKPEPVTRLEAGDFAHRWPMFLPDGKHFLFSVRRGSGSNGVMVGSLDGTAPKPILDLTSNASFVPPGWLVYWRDDALRAQRFDTQRLELTGPAIPIAPGVHFEIDKGGALFSTSANGTLVYHAGTDALTQSRLVLRDRRGHELGTVGSAGNYYAPRLSRDGRYVAVDNSGLENNGDIWVFDLERPVSTRLTFDATDESSPVWSPAGDRVAFYSARDKGEDVFAARLGGARGETALLATAAQESATDWSWDGRHLLIDSRPTETDPSDLWVLSVPDGKATPWLVTPFKEGEARFSPDGRWVVYRSDETGRDEIYVRPFPAGDDRWQVSTAGGCGPLWSADGTEIFYVDENERVMAVPVTSGRGTFQAGAPVALFVSRMRFEGAGHYDVGPTGDRFLVNEWTAESAARPMTLVLDWAAALRER